MYQYMIMKRVMVMGCCGAGKSTFSKRLSMITELDLIHLDQYYWKSSWEETDKLEWSKIVKGLTSKPKWIMDGNYGGTMDIRIEKADTVVYLDYSTIKCLWRITKRTLKYHGLVRPDMPEGCTERFDLNFYHYVATYNLVRRKGTLEKLDRLKGEKQILIFKTDKESDNFLKKIKNEA